MSFFPTKTLGGFGDGGMISAPDADVAASARMLRAHGSRRKYFNEEIDARVSIDRETGDDVPRWHEIVVSAPICMPERKRPD